MSNNRKELTWRERETVESEVFEAICIVISSMVKSADKHNVDRDSLLWYFARLLGTICEFGTFEHWDEGESHN